MSFGMGAGMAAGGITSMLSDIAGQAMTGYFNQREAKRARKFSERMYRNRYRYTMEDMARAGLNPILAYQQGAGSTPGGTAASVGSVPGSGARAMEAATTGGRAVQQSSTARDIRAQIAGQADKTWADAANSWSMTGANQARSEIMQMEKGLAAQDFDFYQTPVGRQVRNMQRVAEATRGQSLLGNLMSGSGALLSQVSSADSASDVKRDFEEWKRKWSGRHNTNPYAVRERDRLKDRWSKRRDWYRYEERGGRRPR